MLHVKFQDHRTSGYGEEYFRGFYHIWALLPSWSCDQDDFATSQEGPTLNLALID